MSKAKNCKLSVKCTCGAKADYSEQMVEQVILAAMFDDAIERKVFSTVRFDHKSRNDTIAIVETEEMASRSMTGQLTSSIASELATKKRHHPVTNGLRPRVSAFSSTHPSTTVE